MSRLKDLERKWEESGLTSDEAEEYEALWKSEDRRGFWQGLAFIITLCLLTVGLAQLAEILSRP